MLIMLSFIILLHPPSRIKVQWRSQEEYPEGTMKILDKATFPLITSRPVACARMQENNIYFRFT